MYIYTQTTISFKNIWNKCAETVSKRQFPQTLSSWFKKNSFKKKSVLVYKKHRLDKSHAKSNFLVVSTRQCWKSLSRLIPTNQSNKMANFIHHEIDKNQVDLNLTPGVHKGCPCNFLAISSASMPSFFNFRSLLRLNRVLRLERRLLVTVIGCADLSLLSISLV